MRHLLYMLFVCLLLPVMSHAQDAEPPLLGYSRNQGLFILREDEAPELLIDTAMQGGLMSPDGKWFAYTSLAAYDANGSKPENRYDPINLSLLNIADHTVTPLWTRGETEPGILIFSKWSTKGVEMPARASWQMRMQAPLIADLAWSPDSRYLAHLQTIMGGGRSALTRLAIFDIQTGEMNIIAKFEPVFEEKGHSVFWLDVGIVVYTEYGDYREYDVIDIADTITLMDIQGNILKTAAITEMLNHENPVRYNGKDYLYMGQNLYDVSADDLMPFEGAIGLVSATASETSLIVEFCMANDEYETLWDVYRPQGDKVMQESIDIEDWFDVALSPDGQQFVYQKYLQKYDNTITIFNGKEAVVYESKATKMHRSFSLYEFVWGPTMYVVTPIGAQDCGRTLLG